MLGLTLYAVLVVDEFCKCNGLSANIFTLFALFSLSPADTGVVNAKAKALNKYLYIFRSRIFCYLYMIV